MYVWIVRYNSNTGSNSN